MTMAYIAYTGTHPDGLTYGGLFNADAAELFEGNDPELETVVREHLYLSENGTWIKNTIRFGNPDVSFFDAITPEAARTWLAANDHPEAVKRYFERPKGGRPRIGERLVTRVPARMHNQIAEIAELYAEDMPDTVRRLLHEALAHRETIGAVGGSGTSWNHLRNHLNFSPEEDADIAERAEELRQQADGANS